MRSIWLLTVLVLCIGLVNGSDELLVTEDGDSVDGNQKQQIFEEETEPTTVALLSIEDISKLRGKELQKMLKKKGVECKGCSEKIDFVTKVFESQGLPDKVEPPPLVKENQGLDKDEIDKLMADLERNGYAKDGRVFTGSDFANLSPEEIAAKMSRGRGGFNPPPRSSKGGKKDKKAAPKKKPAAASKDSSDGFDDEEVQDETNSSSSKKDTPADKKTNSGSSKTAKASATDKKASKDTKDSSSSSSSSSSKSKTSKTQDKSKSEKKQPEKKKPNPTSSNNKKPTAKKVEKDTEFEETIEL